jgi:hypothetical protein
MIRHTAHNIKTLDMCIPGILTGYHMLHVLFVRQYRNSRKQSTTEWYKSNPNRYDAPQNEACEMRIASLYKQACHPYRVTYNAGMPKP